MLPGFSTLPIGLSQWNNLTVQIKSLVSLPLPQIHKLIGASYQARSNTGGIVWADEYNTIMSQSPFYIPRTTSSTHAELTTLAVAILLAPPNKKITIYCDNRTTVNVHNYKSWASNKDIAQLIMECLESKNIDLNMQWVKGHSGNHLNELADQSAERGDKSNTRADIYHRLRVACK